LQAAVRAFAQDGASPASVCTSINRLLCRNMASGRFVTFCYVYIDSSRRKLTYANAGHNPPVIIRSNGDVDRLVPGGTVLGVFAEGADGRFAAYTGADGVRVAIQLEGSELWFTTIGPNDFDTKTPTGVTAVPVSR